MDGTTIRSSRRPSSKFVRIDTVMAKRVRSLVKAISYRLIGSGVSVLVVFTITGNMALSGAVGLGDLVLKTFAYYIHERIWANIAWGRSHNHEQKTDLD